MNKQKGTALITAIVIMSITAAIAYYLVMQQRTTIIRSTYLFNYDQAYHYANGATVWAQNLLFDRFIESAENEGSDKDAVVLINDELPPIEVPSGHAVVTAKLEDLQGKFNLNNLSYDVDLDTKLEQLSRLLSDALEDANQQQVNQIMASINEHIAQFGIEQLPFVHISQLRMLDGITGDIYQQLLLHLTVLPEPTEININTADSIVLQSLLPGIPLNQIEALIAARQQTPFTTLEDLTTQLGGVVDLEAFNSDAMTVDSQYFLLTTIVNIGTQRFVLYSIFQVIEGMEEEKLPVVRMVWRSVGTL